MQEEKEFREPELDQHKIIWLTKKSYQFLRKAKIKKKKSMARLVDNLIKREYEPRETTTTIQE